MSSVHNDLHSWAGKARSNGLDTIYISVDVADAAANTIVSQANEIAALRQALNIAFTGGNHIASELIGMLGGGFCDKYPKGSRHEDVLRNLHATTEYELWCAWDALMRARDIAEAAA